MWAMPCSPISCSVASLFPPEMSEQPAIPHLQWCLHVTSAAAVQSVFAHGLQPRIGPLSEQLETEPAVFMFPSWEDLHDANWLFDEAWPHESEPALLAVDVRGVSLQVEAGFEVVTHQVLGPERIRVLAPDETDWRQAMHEFFRLGGREKSLTSKEVYSMLTTDHAIIVTSAPSKRRCRP